MTSNQMLIFEALLAFVICALLFIGISVADAYFTTAREHRDAMKAMGGRRYVYAFEMDGEMWFAANCDGVVMLDTDGRKLLGMEE